LRSGWSKTGRLLIHARISVGLSPLTRQLGLKVVAPPRSLTLAASDPLLLIAPGDEECARQMTAIFAWPLSCGFSRVLAERDVELPVQPILELPVNLRPNQRSGDSLREFTKCAHWFRLARQCIARADKMAFPRLQIDVVWLEQSSVIHIEGSARGSYEGVS